MIFRVIIASEKSDDIIFIDKKLSGEYRINYVYERPSGKISGGGLNTRTLTDLDQVIQYMEDVCDLIELDDTPPVSIHIHSDTYPNTVIMRKNLRNARGTILRILRNMFGGV